jgi:hypothetical protein
LTPVVLCRTWWVEDWKTPLLKKNDPIAEAKLDEKYKGMHLIDDSTLFKTLNTLEFQKDRRNRGWKVPCMHITYERGKQ